MVYTKRLISVTTLFCILLSMFNIFAFAEISHMQKGDVIEFGCYPQSEIEDRDLIQELTILSGGVEWISYNYYTNNSLDRDSFISNYMKYCDIDLNGEKYRGVCISENRLDFSDSIKGDSGYNSNQKNNGYDYGTYWFKYEPLQWKILDESTGLVLCENVVDSQPIQETSGYWDETTQQRYNDETRKSFHGDYSVSSVRKWLNDNFFYTAFDEIENKIIIDSEIINESPSDSLYNSESTKDKIFLLSYDEACNMDFGFLSADSKDDLRIPKISTDYAKCQGLNEYDGSSWWWLRSLRASSVSCNVWRDGVILNRGRLSNETCGGIRPAMRIDLSSLSTGSIINNSSEVTIDYRSTLVLTVDAEIPVGAKVFWYINGNTIPFSEGEICRIEDVKEDLIISIKLVDEDGNIIKDVYGNEISETEMILVNKNIWKRIVAFLKIIFNIPTIIYQ